MNKPYIICHMMTSVDGRIDCAMTSQLPGVEDYYKTLDELNVPTTVSGRVTAELEMAEPGFFEAKNSETYTQEGFSKKADAKGYEIIVDTKGKLLWPDASDMDKPYLIITSEQVTKEYLAYLDEISILMGAGIDARREMPSVFDGFAMDHPLVHLKLTNVQRFDSDAIWIRYNV